MERFGDTKKMTNLIIDGNNIAFAVYSIIFRGEEPEESGIKDVKNLFDKMIYNFSTKFQTKDIYIAWDGQRGSYWRKSLISEYKATRKKHHPILKKVMTVCKQNMYYNIEIPYFEGDDVINGLSYVLADDKIVISSDKDFIQLVQKGKIKHLYNFLQKSFREIPEHDIIMEKAIVGDGSDNIKGIHGIGIKRFLKLLKNNFVDLTEDQKEIVQKNCIIIDLDKNPRFDEMIQIINDILKV